MSGKEAGESAPPVEIPMTEAKPRPARKSRRRFPVLRRLGQLFSGLVMLGLLIFGGAIAAIETGLFDAMLNERAQAALNDALGPRFMAKVGSTAIRLTADGKLALEARHVDTIDLATGQHMSQAASIRLAVDPKALFSGEIAVNHIEADDVEVDATLLPSGKPLDLKALRVDQVPAALESLFLQLDTLGGVVTRAHTDSVSISSISLIVPAGGDEPLSIALQELDLKRNAEGSIALDGKLTIDDVTSMISGRLETQDGMTRGFQATITEVPLTRFLLTYDSDGDPHMGLDGRARLDLSATRAVEDTSPALSLKASIDNATFYADSIDQSLDRADINAVYDFAKNSIEVLPSRLQFGGTAIPFTAGLIDLDRLNPQAAQGFGIDLLVNDGVSAPAGTGVGPLAFGARVTGRYVTGIKEIQLEQMAASTPIGTLAGSMVIRFKGAGSPEISFGAQSPKLQTEAVKQMWPFWMGAKARTWALANIYGGTITNAAISVFIPQGRFPKGGGPLHLDENELNIGFDMTGGRVNITGDIPPLRDVNGRFDLIGPHLNVTVDNAESYFPSGKSVKVLSGSRFSIPQTYDKPLMAEAELSLAAGADAATELVTFKPIAVLDRTGFQPSDFSGDVKATVKARFGIIRDQNPPPPDWKVHLDLDDVDLGKPVEGRKITGLEGTLDLDPQRAVLEADGKIDAVPASIHMVEPIVKGSGVKREQQISATIGEDQARKLTPGLDDILKGTTKVEVSLLDDGRRAVKADLTRATLSVPWIGWTKGSGIPASAAFQLNSGAGEQVSIDDFDISGDGFGVSGKMSFNKTGLTSAAFDRVKLAAADDYALSIKRGKGGAYAINISGRSADIRPVIARLRAGTTGGKGDKSGRSGDLGSASVRADLDNVIGYNNEKISDVKLDYSARGSKIGGVNFSGVTDSGQAVVSELLGNGEGNTVRLTTGDAGSVVRFLDLYKRMQGGLLNLQMRSSADGSAWAGNIDLRNFRLANEEKLQSIVSTPVGNDGRSLNRAVRKDIDVSSEKFSRGFARIILRGGSIGIENGILRGTQVGATFQGTFRDARGNMDMTGTFMPAYGLNRLFAELPLVGVILGNGRDRGLLGITFRLQGRFDEPKLAINPLSIIAPGVFRQIFEFQ